MTTMTLEIANPSIIPSLKKVLSAIDGITIAKTTRNQKEQADATDVPNDITIAAMLEAEGGKDAGEVSLDSLDSFIASMK